ncbi:MAG TPA: molybdenum cofactor biosynthesis protein MoaE [Chthoniobacterales bacterium]|nr:molybdenum cofactor biosynthesis protein MoaE [Chthoniobacterales bacterium]
MANSICQVLLTDAPLAVPAATLPVEVGGIVDFWGVVRRTEDDAAISGIEYEAHRTMAEHQLRAIAEEGARSFALMQVIVLHRVGFVPVGEASLLVRICCKHRAEAFRACVWIVDELKKRVPIWKHPRFSAASDVESPRGAALRSG